MSNYITNILIHRLLDMREVNIAVPPDAAMHHLLITGPNGSGKTTLLKAILEAWELMFKERTSDYTGYRKSLEFNENRLREAVASNDSAKISDLTNYVELFKRSIEELWGKAEVIGPDFPAMFQAVRDRKFVVAYYGDNRVSNFLEVKSPEKPDLTQRDLKTSKTQEFIKYLVHLKIQAALAKNENSGEQDVNKIDCWFETFTAILRRLFATNDLQLKFNYRHYKFSISKDGVEFPLTQLSAGYSAALDIIADLILKMQTMDDIVSTFELPGIVFIDEVETHLHLTLQKEIMPLLTSVFPKVQFVVTTHSPFVLNSLSNATVYDLKQREAITDLTDYSYDVLAEGYFGVDIESGRLSAEMERLEALAARTDLSDIEKDDMRRLLDDFERIPDVVAPAIKTRYNEVVIRQKLQSATAL